MGLLISLTVSIPLEDHRSWPQLNIRAFQVRSTAIKGMVNLINIIVRTVQLYLGSCRHSSGARMLVGLAHVPGESVSTLISDTYFANKGPVCSVTARWPSIKCNALLSFI